jgi:hypothetical protein
MPDREFTWFIYDQEGLILARTKFDAFCKDAGRLAGKLASGPFRLILPA